jgi:transposase
MTGLRPVATDEQLEVLRLLVDRRRALGEEHTRKTCQLHQLLLELIPGGAKRDLSAAQAKALLAKVRPRDVVGRTRRRVAAELIADLERIYARKKAANKELTELVRATGTSLLDLHGIGPTGAARLLVELVTSPGSRTRRNQTMLNDAVRGTTATARTGPGGQRGHGSDSSATGSHPHAGSSDKSLPGPAERKPTTPLPAAS